MKVQAGHIVFLVVGLVVGCGLGVFFTQAKTDTPEPGLLTVAPEPATPAAQEPMAATTPPNVAVGNAPAQDTATVPPVAQPKEQTPPAVQPPAPLLGDQPNPAQAAIQPQEPAAPAEEAAPPSKAKIWVETTSYKTGVIPNAEKSVREIKVSNQGTDPLIINNVKTTCGCVSAKMADSEIAPGAESKLVLTIDPKRIHGFESKRTVTILSNDAENGQLSIDVLVSIQPEFELVPDGIDFGTVEKGATPDASLILRQLSDQPIEVKEVKTWSPGQGVDFSFELAPESQWLKPGYREYIIKAKLLPEVPPGQLMARFSVITNCERYPNVPGFAKATVTSFYTIQPTNVMLYSTPDNSRQRTATVTISADRAIDVDDISVSNDAIQVAKEPSDQPNTVVLKLSAAPSDVPGTTNETLSFSVKADGKVYRDEVPVKFLVRRVTPLAPNARPVTPPGMVPVPPPTPPMPAPPAAEPPAAAAPAPDGGAVAAPVKQ